MRVCSSSSTMEFQPTLPARGATYSATTEARLTLYFNPRSPHGERHGMCECRQYRRDFNPRSPHGERRISTPILQSA